MMRFLPIFAILLTVMSCATTRDSENFALAGMQYEDCTSDDQNPQAEPWTLVVVPDTQHYTANWSKAPYMHMLQAFDWIVEKKDELNIKMVQGLGDITENWNSWKEWERGRDAWNRLRGHMLYMPVMGNHDSPNSMNEFFPVSDFDGLPWYGGDFGGIENNFFLMTLGGVEYMFLQVEPYDQYSTYRPEGLAWAKMVLDSYPDAKVILATHDIWSTQVIRNELLKNHPNIVLTNGGHSCVREAYYKEGNSHSFVVDYQCDGWEVMKLRYYTFHPKENKVRYYTYSPVTKEYERDADSQGEFHLDQSR
jgi:calcineurin-like phosphoesterase family protein